MEQEALYFAVIKWRAFDALLLALVVYAGRKHIRAAFRDIRENGLEDEKGYFRLCFASILLLFIGFCIF